MSGHGHCPDRTEDVNVPMDTTFSDMHLIHERIREGLKQANFIIPSPVQRKALPRTLCGFDTIFKSKSGTGKTAVFAVTGLQSILDLVTNQPQVLILAPTREIAIQIVDVIRSIGACIDGLKAEYFIGGTTLNDDKEKLKDCRIVVGAPGRVAHLIELGYLNTKSIRLFVVDEADQMLQSSFKKDLNFIFNSLPESKQVLICSATFTFDHINFLQKYMTTISFVSGDEEDDMSEEKLSFASLVGVKQFASTINQEFAFSSALLFVNKLARLLDILKTTTFSQCLIFTNYVTRVKTIANKLSDAGFVTSALCSEQTQEERIAALQNLKQGECRVLVSTDLTARGIDAAGVNTVINFEVPINEQTYLHRMGRAGRYGSQGIVISIAAEGDELKKLQVILGAIKASVAVLPSRAPFVDATDRMKVQELALPEISGIQGAQQPKVDLNNDYFSSYVLSSDFLSSVYGSPMKSLDLESFKSEINSRVNKLPANFHAQSRNSTLELDSYFSFCKDSKNFHPKLVEYVDKIAGSQQYKSALLSHEFNSVINGDSKENICPKIEENKSRDSSHMNRPLPVGMIQDTTKKSKQKKNDGQKNMDFTDKNPALRSTAPIKSKSTMILDLNFLERVYAIEGTEDVDCAEVMLLIEKDFKILKSKSQEFCSKLESRLAAMNMLNDFSKFSSNEVTGESLQLYFYLCKSFKGLNQTIVKFVERKLKKEGDTTRKPVQYSTLPPLKKSTNWSSSASRLPSSLIKRKPERKPTDPFKNSDPPKSRNKLFLRQDFLKRLYMATKINKDFCVENYKATIEPSFTGLWKSGPLPTEVILHLRKLDILQHPMKGLNSQSLEPYFQFCRHFLYLNPQFVNLISKKINKIEKEQSAEEAGAETKSNSEPGTGEAETVETEVLSQYQSELQSFKGITIDEDVKTKIAERFSAETDFVSDLKCKAGPNLLVEQTLNDSNLLSYFKLCQTFKDFDTPFVLYVKQKLGSAGITSSSDKGPEVVNPFSKDSSDLSNITNSIGETSGDSAESVSCITKSIGSYERPPLKSDSRSNSVETPSSLSYEALSKYPLCQAVTKPPHPTMDPQLSPVLVKHMQNLARTAESQETHFMVENTKVVPTVLNLLKNSRKLQPKDVEKFTVKIPAVSSKTASDSKPSKAQSTATNLKERNQADKLETANYQTILQSLHNSDVISSAPRIGPEKVLQEDVKNELNSFVQKLSLLDRNQISISCTNMSDNVKLLYKDDEMSAIHQSNQDSVGIAPKNAGPSPERSAEQPVTDSNRLPSNGAVHTKSNRGQVKIVPASKPNKAQPCFDTSKQKVELESELETSPERETFEDGESSDWVTASSSAETDSEEAMTLCDHCKNSFKSSRTSRRKVSKKGKSKRGPKKHSSSSFNESFDCPAPAPSYEQLIQWYNMWYQQVVYSQQFVWYNEYIRNMSAKE